MTPRFGGDITLHGEAVWQCCGGGGGAAIAVVAVQDDRSAAVRKPTRNDGAGIAVRTGDQRGFTRKIQLHTHCFRDDFPSSTGQCYIVARYR